MPQVRLMGLALMITTIFLALAAVTTQTTHIRIKRPSRAGTQPSQTSIPGTTTGVDSQGTDPADFAGTDPANPLANPATNGLPQSTTPTDSPATVQFIMVPIALPLAVAGIVGLVLWFGPAPRHSSTNARRRRRR